MAPKNTKSTSRKTTPLPMERRYAGLCGSRSTAWSIAHSASTTAPAQTSTRGHHVRTMPQKWSWSSRPVSISRKTTPIAISRMGPSTEPRRIARIW